jgi:hypothetical protein
MQMRFPYKSIHLLIVFFCSGMSFNSFGQEVGMICGPLWSSFGSADYRTSTVESRATVENFHFNQRVESLAGGQTTMHPGGDLSYVLTRFPNHHRALMAVMKLGEKEKTENPRELRGSVACFFDRAERFKPDDAMVKSIYGIYLIRSGKPQAGKAKLEAALSLAGENANIYYNIGLAYFDMKQYEKSLDSAHRAYALGFPLPGLRDKLKRAGKWQDPVVKPTVTAITPATEADNADKAESTEMPAK